MAIDLLGIAKQRRQKTKDLLTARKTGLDEEISGRREAINKRTQRILGSVPALQGVAPDLTKGTAQIGRQVDRTLAGQRLDTSRQNEQQIFDNAVRIAEQFGMSRVRAENFARRFMVDFRRRRAQETEDAKSRDQSRKLADIQDRGAAQLRALQAQFGPNTNFTPEFLASIAGSAATIGATQFATRDRTPKTTFEKSFGRSPAQQADIPPEFKSGFERESAFFDPLGGF